MIAASIRKSEGDDRMKKHVTRMVLLISVMFGIFLTGCSGETFKSVVESEIFEKVPLMTGEEISFSEVEDVGGGNYLIWAYDTDLSDYQAYLKVLEENKFKKYADNGENGIEDFVYTAHYQKDNLLVVVTHYPKMEDTMITACLDAELSEHLIYRDEYVKDNPKDAKTTLTMPELYSAGNSFIIQLKNGHFIISDGGYEEDLPYLLDYLEEHAPNGEKPVVDAWIITHSHLDHMGVLAALSENEKWADRILVEEAYFTEANEISHSKRGGTGQPAPLTFYSKTIPGLFKTTEGSNTKVYRMREGERYYFNDITMDVIYTQDMLAYEEWKTWNATSTVVTFTIEGQKVLFTADADWECQMLMLEVFADSYFDLTVYQTPHHGGNVYNQFSKHLKVECLLYPSPDLGRAVNSLLGRYAQNEYLKSLAKEALNWTDGGVTLTFPYEVGSYERLPLTEWIHSEEPPARVKNR